MKGKIVADIRQQNAELDAEDQEIMEMFRGRRICNERLLVEAGGELWLVDRDEPARQAKRREDAIRFGVTAAAIGTVITACICLAARVGNPAAMLTMGEAGLIGIMIGKLPWVIM